MGRGKDGIQDTVLTDLIGVGAPSTADPPEHGDISLLVRARIDPSFILHSRAASLFLCCIDADAPPRFLGITQTGPFWCELAIIAVANRDRIMAHQGEDELMRRTEAHLQCTRHSDYSQTTSGRRGIRIRATVSAGWYVRHRRETGRRTGAGTPTLSSRIPGRIGDTLYTGTVRQSRPKICKVPDHKTGQCNSHIFTLLH